MPFTAAVKSCDWFPVFTLLLGLVAAGFFEWLRDRRTSNREREAREAARREQEVRDAEQRYRENIEKPVVGFVDETLIMISRAYWNKVDGKDPGIDSIREAVREREASVQARVRAMRRPDAQKRFLALDESFMRFLRELSKAPGGDARDLMRAAWGHAGDFFEAAYGPFLKDN